MHIRPTRRRAFARPRRKATPKDLEAVLLEDYRLQGRRTLKRAGQAAAHLLEHFEDAPAKDLTTADLYEYLRARLAAGREPATVRYELMVLSRMFTLGLRMGVVDRRPVLPELHVRNVRSGFFERGELRAVL